jgi:negative regulator of sigma E activity
MPESRYIGRDHVDGRECVVIEASIHDDTIPHAKKAIVKVDLGYRLPVSVITLDHDDKVLNIYEYTNLRFNMGLQDRHFTKEMNHL